MFSYTNLLFELLERCYKAFVLLFDGCTMYSYLHKHPEDPYPKTACGERRIGGLSQPFWKRQISAAGSPSWTRLFATVVLVTYCLSSWNEKTDDSSTGTYGQDPTTADMHEKILPLGDPKSLVLCSMNFVGKKPCFEIKK